MVVGKTHGVKRRLTLRRQGGFDRGNYENFLAGFVTEDGNAWGRPVGVAVGNGGSLFVSDDDSNSL